MQERGEGLIDNGELSLISSRVKNLKRSGWAADELLAFDCGFPLLTDHGVALQVPCGRIDYERNP